MASASPDHLGLAYIKGQWKYFKDYTPIKRGKNRGQAWVFLIGSGRRRLVHPHQIKRLPTPKGQLKLFK